MKKVLLIVSLLALSLSACVRKEDSNVTRQEVAKQGNVKIVANQFEYKATDNISVLVTEFNNDFGQACVTVHANFIYDSSNADVYCGKEKLPTENKKNEIIKQLTYEAGNTPVQVTMIRTKNNHFCTVVHANYLYDSSTATISCD